MNHRLPVSIALLALAVLLLATALIGTQIILNHSGLLPNAYSSLVAIPSTCHQPYLLQKYNAAQDIRQKVDLFATMTAFIATLFVLLVFVCFGYGCGDIQEQQSQETGLEGNSSRFHFISRLGIVHLSIFRTTTIFVLSALASIALALPAGHYLQTFLQKQMPGCFIQFHEGELLAMTILSCTAEGLAIVGTILTGCLHSRGLKRRIEEEQNGSESYREQVKRIMRQIPYSERRMRMDKDSQPADVVKQIESIIYKAEPQLLLQSVHQPRR